MPMASLSHLIACALFTLLGSDTPARLPPTHENPPITQPGPTSRAELSYRRRCIDSLLTHFCSCVDTSLTLLEL